ncbi:MAG: enoyl-CoA hydratase, partial [Parvibaculum sp.]
PEALLDVSLAMANDMLGLVPDTLIAYKKLIDDGYEASFGEAMQIEHRTFLQGNTHVKASDVEARREAIRQRGQQQV